MPIDQKPTELPSIAQLAEAAARRGDTAIEVLELTYQTMGELVAHIGELASDAETPNDHLAAAITYMGRSMRHLSGAVDLNGVRDVLNRVRRFDAAEDELFAIALAARLSTALHVEPEIVQELVSAALRERREEPPSADVDADQLPQGAPPRSSTLREVSRHEQAQIDKAGDVELEQEGEVR